MASSKKPGLYANINAKQERIAHGSGETMKKPGSEGAPTAAAFEASAKTTRAAKTAKRSAAAKKGATAKKAVATKKVTAKKASTKKKVARTAAAK